MRDYLRMRHFPSLPEIYQRASNPVPIKDQVQGLNNANFEAMILCNKKDIQWPKLNSLKRSVLTNIILYYYCNRADTRIRQGQYQRATADCHKALSLNLIMPKLMPDWGRLFT
ncbi:hypothetical protein CDAR_509481 [Caerostris darwini]|uniref:Uncharacterized protein n=1 Tax=Caerostris darwini TaxID=1538125 RepID=A0AAV4Q2Z0_9ARAC|nr:hypothetical protein CDAR_509481 [Caerostris darwini]